MGRPGRRIDRLLALAHELNVSNDDDLPRMTLPATSAVIAKPEDEARVQDVLTRIRLAQFQQKSHIFRKKPSESRSFKTKETSVALESLVQEGCSAATADLLLQQGADVNFTRRKSESLVKKHRHKDQEDVRSKAFKNAVQARDLDLIRVLARSADQISCDESLGIAINNGDIEVVKVLMAKGADPNLHPAAFHTAIKAENTAMIRALSAGPCTPSSELTSKNLLAAVKTNQVMMIQALLANGANADLRNPSALLWAAQHQQSTSVVALCLARLHPSPQHLSTVVEIICSKLRPISDNTLRIVEVLLAAGAQGEKITSTIVEATKQQQHDLVKLLVEYSDFDYLRSPAAIELAMVAGDLISFDILASLPWDESTRDNLLDFLPKTRSEVPLDTRFTMLTTIVPRRPSGVGPSTVAVSRALLDASENDELSIAEFLVGAGASIDYESGKALTVAVNHQSLELLSILLVGRPSINTLLRGVGASASLPSAIKFSTLNALLHAGAIGPEVDRALQLALEDNAEPRQNYELIALLVRNGADVNVGQGKCLISVVTCSDVKALKLLVSGTVKPRPQILDRALFIASDVQSLQARFYLMKLILQAGARGNSVARVLINVIRDGSPDLLKISQLLLVEGEADVNYDQGSSICTAIKGLHVELLHILLQQSPSSVTMSRGIDEAMQVSDQSCRLEICGILLKHGVPHGAALNEALAAATKLSDHALARALLNAGASTDYNNGLPISTAMAKMDDAMLGLLVASPAQPGTLLKMLEETLKHEWDEDRKLFVLGTLFRGASLTGDSLGSLLHETFGPSHDLRVLELFLSKGASVNCSSLNALRKAVALSHAKALELIMCTSPTPETVRIAFEFAWNAAPGTRLHLLNIVIQDKNRRSVVNTSQYLVKAVNENPSSAPLVSLLLHAGASVGYHSSKSMRDAAARLDIETLNLLLNHAKTDQLAAVFEATLNTERTWSEPSGTIVLSMLLDKGAYGEVVNHGLLSAVEKYHMHANVHSIVKLLVMNSTCPASSDYRDGAAFEVAARLGDIQLIEALFHSGPSESTVTNAFPYIFKSHADQATTSSLVDAFLAYSREKLRMDLDLNVEHKDPELQPVLFLCLQRWPQSSAILSKLLQAGAFADQKTHAEIEDGAGAESVTVLLWALSQEGKTVDKALIQLLLENSANPNFATKNARVTPLLAATKTSRTSIVEVLLLHGADPSLVNSSGWSALRYASAQGDLEIIKLLTGKEAPIDDGSLQEAVVNSRHAAATWLLGAGHGPNFPSTHHDMRPSLEHLIRESPVSDDPSGMKSMFKVLFKAGADFQYHCDDGKSLLILALDMPHATMIVPVLLSAFMGTYINDDFNQYRRDGFVYSPTSYLIHAQHSSKSLTKIALLKVLRTFKCEDLYYHERGPQPDDYTDRTAPKDVVNKENRRRRKLEKEQAEDTERRRRMEIEDQERERRVRIEQEDENNRKRRAFEAHETELIYERERSQANDANVTRSAAVRLQLQSEEHAQAQRFALTERQAEIAHKREQNRLQLEWKEQSVAQDLRVMQAKVAAERAIEKIASIGRQEQAAIEYANRPAIGYARTIYDSD